MDWDDPLPDELLKEWRSIYADLRDVKHIRVPRWIYYQFNVLIELHGFGEASKKAFASVIYLRVIQDGYSTVSLVSTKTKVTR